MPGRWQRVHIGDLTATPLDAEVEVIGIVTEAWGENAHDEAYKGGPACRLEDRYAAVFVHLYECPEVSVGDYLRVCGVVRHDAFPPGATSGRSVSERKRELEEGALLGDTELIADSVEVLEGPAPPDWVVSV